MAIVSDEDFALLLLENYWESWSTKNVEEYNTEVAYAKSQIKRKKQHGVNLLVVPWVQNNLEDGLRRASYDSTSYIQK